MVTTNVIDARQLILEADPTLWLPKKLESAEVQTWLDFARR